MAGEEAVEDGELTERIFAGPPLCLPLHRAPLFLQQDIDRSPALFQRQLSQKAN